MSETDKNRKISLLLSIIAAQIAVIALGIRNPNVFSAAQFILCGLSVGWSLMLFGGEG